MCFTNIFSKAMLVFYISIIVFSFCIYENLTLVKLMNDEGLNILGNLILCSNESINRKFYGPIEVYARNLLGYSYIPLDEHKLIPSVLEHMETSLRDPVMYQWMMKILNWSRRYMLNVAPYTKEELMLPGVEIEGVKMDPLITFVDYYYSDMMNAVWYNEDDKLGAFPMRVRQIRMNHKPFTYKLTVKAASDQDVVVKMYMGPLYDEYGRKINLTENHLNFISLDKFTYKLKAGENEIERSCHDFPNYAPDRLSWHRMARMVEGALNGTDEFNIPHQNSRLWPKRTMLPRGSEAGRPFQFLFFIHPHHSHDMHMNDVDLFHDKETYPLDRMIEFEKMWETLPNALFHEEKIYYKDIYGLNPVFARV